MPPRRPYRVIRLPARAVADVGVMLLALVLAIWPLIAAFLLYRLITILL